MEKFALLAKFYNAACTAGTEISHLWIVPKVGAVLLELDQTSVCPKRTKSHKHSLYVLDTFPHENKHNVAKTWCQI